MAMASICKTADGPSNGAFSLLCFSPSIPHRFSVLHCPFAHHPHDGRISKARKKPMTPQDSAKSSPLRPLGSGSSYGSEPRAPQKYKPRSMEQVLPQHHQPSSQPRHEEVMPEDAKKNPQKKHKWKRQRIWIDKSWKPSFVKALWARIKSSEGSKDVKECQRSESNVGHEDPCTDHNRLAMFKQESQICDKDSPLSKNIVTVNIRNSNLESCRLTGVKQENEVGDKDYSVNSTKKNTVTKNIQNSNLESCRLTDFKQENEISDKDYSMIINTVTEDLQNSNFESCSLREFKQENQVTDNDHPPRRIIMNTSAEGPLRQSDDLSFYDLDVKKGCKQGLLKDALSALELMDQQGIRPCPDTYICLLQECMNKKALWAGMQVHAHMVKDKFKGSVFIGNTLINMYLTCGHLVDARRVFRNMPVRNVYTWTLLITECAKLGYTEEAIKLYKQMKKDGIIPDRVTFLSVLKACASREHFEQGKQVHALVTELGYDSDIFVGSTLVDMYAKCSSLEDARQVFDKMPRRTVASWNAMIAGYAKIRQGEDAFKLLQKLEWEGLKPTQVTFVNILNACASPEALEQGRWVHMYIIDSGLKPNVYVGNALVAMYTKCGSLDDALVVFNRIPGRNVVSWTSVIGGYAQHGHRKEANKLFQQMLDEGLQPDKVALLSTIKAGRNVKALQEGKKIHANRTKEYLHI